MDSFCFVDMPPTLNYPSSVRGRLAAQYCGTCTYQGTGFQDGSPCRRCSRGSSDSDPFPGHTPIDDDEREVEVQFDDNTERAQVHSVPEVSAEDPNPKQRYGDKKPPVHLVPAALNQYASLAMMDGRRKYGAFNWRDTRVEAMTYVGAIKRHLDEWVDGMEYTEDTGIPSLSGVAGSLAILCDAVASGDLIDNRPAPGPCRELSERFVALIEDYKERFPPE